MIECGSCNGIKNHQPGCPEDRRDLNISVPDPNTLHVKVPTNEGDHHYGILFIGPGDPVETLLAEFPAMTLETFAVQIDMPCKLRYDFKNPKTFPRFDLACMCGRPNHWVVKYES